MLSSSLSLRRFNGLSPACGRSHFSESSEDTSKDIFFSIKEKVLKGSEEAADRRVMVKLLHRRVEVVIYLLQPGSGDHRR